MSGPATQTLPAFGHAAPSGSQPAALTVRRRVLLFVGVLVALVVVAELLGVFRNPPAPPPACPSFPCVPQPGGDGNPDTAAVHPLPDSNAPEVQLDGQWTAKLGVVVSWRSHDWTRRKSEDSLLVLDAASGDDVSLVVEVAAAQDATPTAMKQGRLSVLDPVFPDLVTEPDPQRQPVGVAAMALRPAEASVYVGTYTDGGLSTKYTVALVTSGTAGVSVVFQLIAADADRLDAFRWTDPVLDFVEWPQ